MATFQTLVVVAALSAALIACGGSGATGAYNKSGRTAGPTSLAGATITITANNVKFNTDALSAPAGDVAIVLGNIDRGVPHNIRVRRGGSASGESVGKTDIASGPASQTLRLTLAAGTYYFLCDVHPSMNGVLTVQ